MGPEEAAEEALKGPFKPCLYCHLAIDPEALLTCKQCYGTGQLLRRHWVEAATQLGLHEQLERAIRAIAHAKERSEQLLKEQRLYKQVQVMNEKAKRIQEDDEARRRLLLRQIEQDYELRKLKK